MTYNQYSSNTPVVGTIMGGGLARTLAMLALVASFASSLGFGQVNTATISGTVTDAGGGSVPSVLIEARNEQTNLTRSAKTDTDGLYIIPLLPVGVYEITATSPGFETIKRTDNKLDVGQAARVDFQLRPGGVSTSVTVTAQPSLVNTENAGLGTVVDQRRIQDLPLDGRSIMSLVILQSGTMDATNSGRFTFQFSGIHSQGSNFLVDGTDVTRLESQSLSDSPSGLTTLSLDTVQEFKVDTGVLPAADPRAAGGLVNIVTKSGTNRLHGSGYEFYRGNVTAANDFFANAAGAPEHHLVSNQPGGTLGGAIVKDKLFFFVGDEALRVKEYSVSSGLMLTPSFISSISSPPLQAVLSHLPVPQTVTADPRLGVVTNVAPYSDSADLPLARLDWNPTSKDHIFARANLGLYRTINPGLGPALSSASTIQDKRGTFSWTHTFSPTLVNEFVYGENHDLFTTDAARLSQLGIFLVGGLTGYGGSLTLDFGSINSKFCCRSVNFSDNLMYRQGKHSIAAGAQLRRVDPLDVPYLFPPNYSYNTLADLQGNTPAEVTFVFGAHSAPGNPNSEGYIEFGPDNFMQYGYYIQDDWHVKSRLTLNLGLRYDYWPALTSTQRLPCCSDINVVSDPFGPYRPFGERMYNTQSDLFSPRFGFAYDLTGSGKAAIRGGFGIMRAPEMLTVQNAVLYLNPGVSSSGTLLASAYPNLAFPVIGSPPLNASNRDLLDPNYKTMYAETWTLTLEKAVSDGTIVRAIYTGDHTLHNQWSNRFNVPISPNGAPVFPDPNTGLIRFDEGSKMSKYNSLQLNLQHRFQTWHGFDVFYTWSHGLDDIGTADSQAIVTVGAYQDVRNAKAEYASNSNDFRHNLIFDYILQPPLASWAGLTNSWGRHLIDGWGFEGITTVHSGVPVNITTGGDVGNTLYTQRPNLAPGVPTRIPGGNWVTGMYNPAAYAIPTVAEAGTGYLIGDLGSRTERGPGFWDFDFSISRNFRIGERSQLQVRADAFNVLNHVNFQMPISTMENVGSTFGRSLSDFGARQLQLGIHYTF